MPIRKGVKTLQEIQLPSNKTGIKVFINGVPDVSQVHSDNMKIWATVLDKVLSEHIDNYHKRRARDRPEKKKVSEKTDT